MAEIVLDSACTVPAQPHRINIAIVNETDLVLSFMNAPLMVGIFAYHNNILLSTVSQAVMDTTRRVGSDPCL